MFTCSLLSAKAAVAQHVMSHTDMMRVLDDEMDSYFESKHMARVANDPTIAKCKKTTVMIRNIDSRMVPQEAMDKLASLGIIERCDFYFMPMFTGGRRNKGYFFLNFRETPDVVQLKEQLRRIVEPGDRKTIEVTWATWQGLPELRRHFWKRSVNRQQNRPIFL